MRPVLGIVALLAATLVAATALAQKKKEDRETKVRRDKDAVTAAGAWIYDDLPRGTDEAKKSGKPLLVVFRCIPCEACAKLDEDVVTRDPSVAKLLDQFVCVRIPKANGMDLSLFQFDYDQSWAAFFMNADMTIYGRYGTRSSQKELKDDVSLEGFGKALEAGLKLHNARDFIGLKGKLGRPADTRTPEELPSLAKRFKTTLDWEGKVVPSCMHCHMIRDAQRASYRDAGKPIPERLLFPYPNPKALGLVMDPKEKARVTSVVAGSQAAKDGFLAGDEIVKLFGQPVLSIADVQWVLDGMGDTGEVTAVVARGTNEQALMLHFEPGWRRNDDISWRATSWDLRRITTGGLMLETLPAEGRTKLGIAEGTMALSVKHVGQYGAHAVAKNAGFQQGDVVVSVGGRTDVRSETEWMTWLVNARKPGDKVPVTVLRDGKKVELTLPMQ